MLCWRGSDKRAREFDQSQPIAIKLGLNKQKMSRGVRFWVGVASKDHVENGVEWGISQFCHGKMAPAKRLKRGDFVIYYSSKVTMDGSDPYQKFTAIGVVDDDAPYQVDMGNDFKPFRRNVTYMKEARHVDIRPLIPYLDFIKNKKAWGGAFRFGFFEIDRTSFDIISGAMLGSSPLDDVVEVDGSSSSA